MKSLSLIFILFLIAFSSLSEAQNSSFTYADLEKIMSAQDFNSIDAFLAALPRSYLANYTFMYQSQSLQAPYTSAQTPRALVFGDDAKLMMTFTEGSRDKKDDSVEVMNWDENKSTFVFHEFRLGSNGKIQTGEANPGKCIRCHGPTLRPIWEPYRTWPGAFGSLSKNQYDRIGKNTYEEEAYVEFMAKSRESGRYAVLPREILRGKTDEDGNKYLSNGAVNDPNALLNKHISALNSMRGAAFLKNEKSFPQFKYALAALYGGCMKESNEAESFFPNKVKSGHPGLDATVSDTQVKTHAQYLERSTRTLKYNTITSIPIEEYSTIIAGGGIFFTGTFRYIVELMGLDFSELRTAFNKDSYEVLALLDTSYNQGYTRMIYESFAENEAPAESLSSSQCADLKKISLEKLSHYDPKSSPVIVDNKNATLISGYLSRGSPFQVFHNVCLQCHDGQDASIRKLPFDTEDSLRTALRDGPYSNSLYHDLEERLLGTNGKEKMPLGTPLTSEQVKTLMSYLSQLTYGSVKGK